MNTYNFNTNNISISPLTKEGIQKHIKELTETLALERPRQLQLDVMWILWNLQFFQATSIFECQFTIKSGIGPTIPKKQKIKFQTKKETQRATI